MGDRHHAALVASFVLGCAALGPRVPVVELERGEVRALSARLYGGRSLCPGFTARLVVEVTLADGRRVTTEEDRPEVVAWESLDVRGRGASLEPGGVVRLSADPAETRDAPAQFVVRVAGLDEPSAVVQVPARYDCAFVADFSGAEGADGEDGLDGADGGHALVVSSGGWDGGDGHGGAAGGHGEDVEVTTRSFDAVRGLVEVSVRGLTHGRTASYVVAADGGTLLVRTNGGRGGHGGRGGNGGHGGTARAGAGMTGGSGGQGGFGGSGGDGGNGGRIRVVGASSSSGHPGLLSFENRAGLPGRNGPGGMGGVGSIGGGGTVPVRRFLVNAPARSGRSGEAGEREGRPGRAGPPVEVLVGEAAAEAALPSAP